METKSSNKEFVSLHNHLKENGPMRWRSCFISFSNFLDSHHDTIISSIDSILLTSDSIAIKNDGEDNGLELSYAPVDDKEDFKGPLPQEAYMSPDHLLEAQLDERSCIYSIGCILFECLSGRPPFNQKRAKVLAEQHIAFEPTGLDKLLNSEEIPASATRLIHTCIEKDPDNRIQTIKQLSEELKECAESKEETVQKDVTPVQKGNRGALIVSTVIMIILTAVTVTTISTTNSKEFQKLVYHSKHKNKNVYYLSVENGRYRAQMDFKHGRLKAEPGAIPIYIRQAKLKKILFATTQKKTIKEAVLEALRRGLRLHNADLKGADLQGIDLQRVNMPFTDFTDANLEGANLSGTIFDGSRFWKAKLKNAILHKTSLSKVDFSGADLTNAQMNNAYIPHSVFVDAILKNASLKNALLSSSIFMNTNMEGAILENANVVNVKWNNVKISDKQLKQVKQDQQFQGLKGIELNTEDE